MEESRSSTSVHSPSRGDSDVETALSFNLSEISTANSFDYDELIDLVGRKRSRREAKTSQDTHDEVNVEVGKPLEELPAAYGQDMDNDLTQDTVLLPEDTHLLEDYRASAHSVLARSPRETRAYVVVRPVSDSLMPGARRVRSFSAAESVTQSESDTSTNRDTYEPDYSSPAITDSAAVTPPEQTRLSYDSEYGSSVTASQESVTDDMEAGEWTTVPAGIIVSFDKEKHGIEMDLGICMSLNAAGGPLVLSTLTLPDPN